MTELDNVPGNLPVANDLVPWFRVEAMSEGQMYALVHGTSLEAASIALHSALTQWINERLVDLVTGNIPGMPLELRIRALK